MNVLCKCTLMEGGLNRNKSRLFHHLGRGRQVKDEEREAQRWGEAFRSFQQGQRRKKLRGELAC